VSRWTGFRDDDLNAFDVVFGAAECDEGSRVARLRDEVRCELAARRAWRATAQQQGQSAA
jgi:hypothetical protein